MRFVDVEHRGIEPALGLSEIILGRPFFYAENAENGSTMRDCEVFVLRGKSAYMRTEPAKLQKKVYTKFTRNPSRCSIYFCISLLCASARAFT